MGLLRRPWIELTVTTFVASPVVIVIGVLVARTNAPWLEPYWLDVSSKATGSFIVLAPALAGLSAWDAARWRVLSIVPVRGSVELLLRHLMIVAAIAVATFTASTVVLLAHAAPSTGAPHWGVLFTAAWLVVAYSALGFAIGSLLPRIVAAPVALAGVWFWVAYTPAVQPFWLRNVNGNLAASCCTLDTELTKHALLAPSVVGASLVVGSLLVVLRPRAVTTWVVTPGIVTVAVLVAWSWMADVGADPVRARDGARDCVVRSGTTLCSWPEHAAELEAGADQLGAAASRMRSIGLTVPASLEEGSKTAGGGWTFNLSGASAEAWVRTLSTSPLSSLPPSCIERNGGLWPAGEHLPVVTAWLEVVAGASSVRQAADDSGAPRRELEQVLRRSSSAQVAWYDAMRTALDGCEPVS